MWIHSVKPIVNQKRWFEKDSGFLIRMQKESLKKRTGNQRENWFLDGVRPAGTNLKKAKGSGGEIILSRASLSLEIWRLRSSLLVYHVQHICVRVTNNTSSRERIFSIKNNRRTCSRQLPREQIFAKRRVVFNTQPGIFGHLRSKCQWVSSGSISFSDVVGDRTEGVASTKRCHHDPLWKILRYRLLSQK